jgi:hypothetical protein
MKTLLYILSTFILFTNCKSIEKMVENGQYDEAIVFATRKLAGKKNKKTSHIQALENAFYKVTQKDMDLVNYLDAENNPENWIKLIDISNKIQSRQNKIQPFLPLISKDGYEANFKFVNVNEMKNTALDGAAQYHYDMATNLLDDFKKTDNKSFARQAYSEFEQIKKYRKNYKNSYVLQNISRDLGVVHIKLEWASTSNVYIPEEMIDFLNNISTSQLNSLWRKYYMSETDNINFDYIADLSITAIELSPEKEIIKQHIDKKKVKAGWEYVTNKKGEIKKDTSGNKIKRDVFQMVKAEITEIQRDKMAFVSGMITQKKASNGEIITSVPLSIESRFSDYAVRYFGDKRAICAHDIGRLKDYPLAFPDDLSMILDASIGLKNDIIDELKSLRI